MDTHAGFGHKRLVVVDPQMENNQWSNIYMITDTQSSITEKLYNTEDIRKERILKGYSVNDHSDTGILLTPKIHAR